MIKLNLLENSLKDVPVSKRIVFSLPLLLVTAIVFLLAISSHFFLSTQFKPQASLVEQKRKDIAILEGDIKDLSKYESLLNDVKQNEEKVSDSELFFRNILKEKTLNWQMEMITNSIPQSVFVIKSIHEKTKLIIEGKSVDYLGISTFVDNFKLHPRVKEATIKESKKLETAEKEDFLFTVEITLGEESSKEIPNSTDLSEQKPDGKRE